MNPMQLVRVEKLTLNIGAGTDQKKLERGIKLIKNVTGISPVKTFAKKRIPSWGLRPSLPIGCKVTLRRSKALDVLKRLIESKNNHLKPEQIGKDGNISFGVHEYIDIPGVKYDPEVGVMGFEVCVTLEKPGYRIKRRKIKPRRIHHKHQITKEETIEFLKKEFNVSFEEE
jgi:large subunit ribosomal protein L5